MDQDAPLRSTRAIVRVGAAALAVVALAAGCGSGSSSSSSKAATLDVKLADYTVTLGSATAASGDVTLAISNGGKETHELVVLRTDLPADKLPTDSAGDVDEEGAGLTSVDEREGIAPGSSVELPLHVKAGRYVLLCNLPGHYAKGMHAELTVQADAASVSSGSAESGGSDDSGASTSPEDRIVSAAEVAAGLTRTKAALAALGQNLGTDPAKAMLDVYDIWYGYEGTLRHTDQSVYLDLEDQLAAAKHAADAKDTSAMATASTKFAALADAYIVAHPA